MAPSLGLGLGVDKPRQGFSGASSFYLADWGSLAIAAWDLGFAIAADTGSLTIVGQDASYKVSIGSDAGSLAITGRDAGLGYLADAGGLAIAGVDGRTKIGVRADAGGLAIAGVDTRYKVGIGSDAGSLAISGVDGRTKVSIGSDAGSLAIAGQDSEWEEDFVAVYDPVSVTVNASATNSSAFSIPGKIAWITAPVTTSTRTVKLQHTPDSGTTWNDTGVSWTTSTSVQTEVNSETLAKISGATGPGLSNFRLNYDTALSGNTSHIIRSRT